MPFTWTSASYVRGEMHETKLDYPQKLPSTIPMGCRNLKQLPKHSQIIQQNSTVFNRNEIHESDSTQNLYIFCYACTQMGTK